MTKLPGVRTNTMNSGAPEFRKCAACIDGLISRMKKVGPAMVRVSEPCSKCAGHGRTLVKS